MSEDALDKAIEEANDWLFLKAVELEKGGPKKPISQVDEELLLSICQGSKQPMVFVGKDWKIVFNDAAKRYTREEETREHIQLLLSTRLKEAPFMAMLSSSLKELAEYAPDLRLEEASGRVDPEHREP